MGGYGGSISPQGVHSPPWLEQVGVPNYCSPPDLSWHHRCREQPCYCCMVVRVLTLHYPIPAVREKVVSFLPDGHKNLFFYSACSNATQVERWQHLIITGQGLKPRSLTWLLLAAVEMGPLFYFSLWCLDKVSVYSLKFFCLADCPFFVLWLKSAIFSLDYFIVPGSISQLPT